MTDVLVEYYDWSGGYKMDSGIVQFKAGCPEPHNLVRIGGQKYVILDIQTKDSQGSPITPIAGVIEFHYLH